ncbi:leukocyte elastase inhibitor-like [Asbolus verrucosus]|uniref:Leukocyte elastase inhibitor-like n=1 Tax=Asbolus verrucosus TaxID=1661398 RepID=A0A482V6L5_ASBVE|nr:leukocyte elastase inhibitor-like [Asbolus verrucosus]
MRFLKIEQCGTNNTIKSVPDKLPPLMVIKLVRPPVDQYRHGKHRENHFTGAKGNVFFSPISLHAVLSMLYHGAQGGTAHALVHTLKNSDAEGYRAVIDDLNSLKEVKLMMANKIYGNKTKSKLLKEFENVLTKNFSSEVEFLDMAHQKESSKIINKWVEEKTENKIKNIVNENNFNENVSLILVNAIYFKGKWSSQFDESKTKTADFFLDKVNSIDVKMMYDKGKYVYKYDKELDAQVIEIPYRGFHTSMILILPSEDNNIKNLEAKLSTSDFSKITEHLKLEDVHLYLPKFKMEETIKLNDILSELGLSDIFDVKKANFGGIIEGITLTNNLYVSEIIQKAYIKVNEGGTEAAAATRASMMVGCAPGRPQPVIFKVNRPAVFMLVASHGADRTATRSILFYGRLSHPNY